MQFPFAPFQHNKTTSFKIPVTLWVYGKKVQIEALDDLEATTNFINRVTMENNNLVTHKLANLYYVINADGTPNKINNRVCPSLCRNWISQDNLVPLYY